MIKIRELQEKNKEQWQVTQEIQSMISFHVNTLNEFTFKVKKAQIREICSSDIALQVSASNRIPDLERKT